MIPNPLFSDPVMPPVAHCKSNEWYTPAKYIEAAREVMGGIDLDPASCEMANRTVQATRYYDEATNGLLQRWEGCVWLNPPYGRIHPERKGSTKSYQLLFIQKLLRAYADGNIEQAICLIIGTSCFMRWFQPLWNYPLCFHDGRIIFDMPDGTQSDFGFGNIIAYLGPNEQTFIDIFSKFGTVARRVSPPPAKPATPSLWDSTPATHVEGTAL